MIATKTITGIILLLFSVLATSSLGGRVMPVEQPAPASGQLTWTRETWTGSDQPYQAIRADVDGLALTGKLTKPLIDEYQHEYERAKNDPYSVFRYAYAFYRGRQLQPPIYPKNVMTDFPFEAAPSPHTYNYDRIRFLANATCFPDTQFAEVAKRLLKYNHEDYDVESALIDCLRPWESAANKQEALGYANDLVYKSPNNQSSYSALAHVYFSSWMVRHNQPDAKAAIAATRKCIQLLPSGDPRRAFLEDRIKYIQERTAQ